MEQAWYWVVPIFCVWTEETTKVFKVEIRDTEIWPLVQQELNDIYGKDVTRCPSRLSNTAKAIKEMIRTNIPKYCQVIDIIMNTIYNKG